MNKRFGQAYYDYMKENDWWKTLEHRRYSYDAWITILQAAHPSLNDVVEIGCGLGMFTRVMATHSNAPKILACDLSNYAITEAQQHLADLPNVTFHQIDALLLPCPPSSIDVVVGLDVLEHLHDPGLMLAKAHEILRPGGLLFLSLPNPESLGARIKMGKPDLHDNSANPLRWFAWHDPTHVSIFPIAEWRRRLRALGFVKVRDGSDFWWDTPYFRRIPNIVLKIVFNGSHRILSRLFGFAPWNLGENYIGLWRKP